MSPQKVRKLQKSETMKAATLVRILLIILFHGIAGFAVGGISFTHEKKDVDMQISHQKKDTLLISPILSTLLW